MSKKSILISMLVVLAVVAAGAVYGALSEQAGKEKLRTAVFQLKVEDPKLDNPCLGASVTRQHTYAELNQKSVSEIKELAKKDPGSC
jgi:hypothetical protein